MGDVALEPTSLSWELHLIAWNYQGRFREYSLLASQIEYAFFPLPLG